MLKKKQIGYVGEPWSSFKTWLTHDYITNPKRNLEPPYMMYSYIDKNVWEEFVKSRTTLEFLAKIHMAKNIYPHRLSRGGYDELEQIMINEKRKQ